MWRTVYKSDLYLLKLNVRRGIAQKIHNCLMEISQVKSGDELIRAVRIEDDDFEDQKS